MQLALSFAKRSGMIDLCFCNLTTYIRWLLLVMYALDPDINFSAYLCATNLGPKGQKDGADRCDNLKKSCMLNRRFSFQSL